MILVTKYHSSTRLHRRCWLLFGIIALFVIFLGVLTQLRVGPAVRLLDGADREILLELIMRR